MRAAARIFRLGRAFFYDFLRYCKHSNYLDFNPPPSRMAGEALRLVHSLEKGLTMPGARRPFGQEKINRLGELRRSIERNPEHAWLLQYIEDVVESVKRVNAANISVEHLDGAQAGTSSQEESRCPLEDPKRFFSTRRSVRNFMQNPLSEDLLADLVACAQMAPSVCNRQGGRVRIFQEPTVKQAILALQQGNKGFGHLIPAVVVVSSDLEIMHSIGERNQAWIDGGLFAMNLCLAAHAFRLGSCFLNWSAPPEQDRQLRDLLDIPENEVIITMLALGEKRGTVFAESRRRPMNEVWLNRLRQ